MSIKGVEAKGFLFPPIRGKVPVVVSVKQGLNPVENQSNLVLAGPGGLAVGGTPSISVASSGGIISSPAGSLSEPYRVRAYFLADISSSMGYPASGTPFTKLRVAQDKIETLSSGLKKEKIDGLEQILIPYDEKAEIIIKTKNSKELTGKVRTLHPRGDTNFTAALNVALEDINSNPLNQARNLIIMVTDGEHNRGKNDPLLKTAVELLPKADCGIYLVGVSEKYDEELLKTILKTARFGGLTHIPHPKQDVFKDILPPFIRDMRSAQFYPVVSFSSHFASVSNMSPSVREVIEELYEHELKDLISAKSDKHFPATIGYQLKGYAVGFVDEKDLNRDASIHLLVKEDANGKPIHTEEIIPVPFEDAFLDPKERELIKQFPLLAQLESILGNRDANSLEQLIKDNKDKLNPDFIKLLTDILGNLRNPNRTAEDEGETRKAYSSITGSVADATFRARSGLSASNFPLFANSNPESDESPSQSSQSGSLQLHSGPPGPLNPNEGTINVPPMDVEQIDPAAYGIPSKKLTLEVINSKGKKVGEIKHDFKDKDEFIFGRSESKAGHIQIPNPPPVLSREHFSISRRDDKFYIKDLGSMNGTYVNTKKITEQILMPGDLIKVCSVFIKVSF